MPVSGFVRSPLEPLVDAFANAVARQGGGAALAVELDGVPVLDLVGGTYAETSAQLVFSVTKLVTAIASVKAAESGLLDLDQPIGSYWPEFAKPSTATVTTRDVLSHRSGVASIDRVLSFRDLLAGAADDAVGHQEPYWEPGTRLGYHAFTFGAVIDGVFRRVIGTRVGDYIQREIADPLDLDLWLGTPHAVRTRVMPIDYTRRLPLVAAPGPNPIPPSPTNRLSLDFDLYNDPRIHDAAWPSLSGVATARALAKLLSATLDGRLISEAALKDMVAEQAGGHDEVLQIPMRYGTGVQLAFPSSSLLGPSSFGHEGAGGSAAVADRSYGVTIGWTTSVYPPVMGASPEFLELLGLVQQCLDRSTHND